MIRIKAKISKKNKKRHNRRNNNFLFVFILLVILLLVIVSVVWIDKVNEMTSNEASLRGGLLGAYATILLGLIAFYQNKRYKELADEMNDRTYMPELYKAVVTNEQLSMPDKAAKNRVFFRVENEKSTKQLDCGSFGVLNSPIIDFSVQSISNSEKAIKLVGEKASYYQGDVGFFIFLTLPSDFLKPSSEYSVVFEYENIYGTRYQKNASFTLNSFGSTGNWKLERARRAPNGTHEI